MNSICRILGSLIFALLIAGSAGSTTLFAHEGEDHNGEVIAYRLTEWKEMHFDDPRQADLHLQAVKKLGCEAKKDAHGGHIDVVYRSPEWKQITVKSHDLVEQWEKWLVGAGFECWHVHVDEALTVGEEAVEYRLLDWKSIHFESNDEEQLQKTKTLLTKVGCEVKQDSHGGHVDLSYRCPAWGTIRLPNHRTADQWMSWLTSMEFETNHEHE